MQNNDDFLSVCLLTATVVVIDDSFQNTSLFAQIY